MDEQEKSFLGVGWGFPPTFNKTRADVEMVSENKDIKESLEIYFATRFGERVMRSDYGCIIHDLAFKAIEIISLGILGFIILNHKTGMNEIRILVGYPKGNCGELSIDLRF